jgi:hypothetical protein
MAESARKFESKRDGWIMALLWSGVFISVYAFWAAWPELTAFELKYSLPLVIATCALLLWFGYGTSYQVEGEFLLVRCGPIRSRVLLSEIEEVLPSRNPLSAPACSLDRLHVRTRMGRGVLISPEDKVGFLNALAASASQLRVEGHRAISEDA